LGDSQHEKQGKHYNRARQERKHRKSGVGGFCCKIMERAGNAITAVTVRVGDPQRRIRNQYTGNHKQQTAMVTGTPALLLGTLAQLVSPWYFDMITAFIPK